MFFSNFVEEFKAIYIQWSIWLMLGTQDIKLRYRRSTLGPFWITISTGITVYSMGLLYGHIFKVELSQYIPYLASGIITWTFISTLILESSNAFIESEVYIKNQESFLSLFIMRLLLRNFLIFLHNILVFIPILFIFHIGVSFNTLLMIPGLLIIFINILLWGNFLAVLGTRFRDFPPIISSLVQVVFFLTPIMWQPDFLSAKYQWAVEYNPFNQFINLIRFPLLNKMITANTLLIVIIVTAIGILLYESFFGKYKNRVVFWL